MSIDAQMEDKKGGRDIKERQRALDLTLSSIEKQFGKGAVMRLGDSRVDPVQAISTGAINLDIATGIGGLPRGRIVELFGPESSGKTTLALHVVAEAQKAGGIAAFVDAEHALDPNYAKTLGVDLAELYVSQPDSGEQALEITEQLVRSSAIDVVVVDSVAALVPKAEIEGEMGDQFMGLQARLMSQAMRKLTSAISRSNTCAIFINQIREKIGVMFGNPETTPGGRALKFYSSMRLDIRRVETLKDGNNAIGTRVKVKVVKNKMAPPFRIAEFDVLFGEGIARMTCLLESAVELNVVDKSGAWFAYNNIRIGQGKDGAGKFLKENPKIATEIEQKVREKAGLVSAPAEESEKK
jgi:recombination protein RecA